MWTRGREGSGPEARRDVGEALRACYNKHSVDEVLGATFEVYKTCGGALELERAAARGGVRGMVIEAKRPRTSTCPRRRIRMNRREC